MPDWITDDLYAHLLNFSYSLIDIMNGAPGYGRQENTELIRLEGGVLLSEIIGNMETAIKGGGPKYHLYSGVCHYSPLQAISYDFSMTPQ